MTQGDTDPFWASRFPTRAPPNPPQIDLAQFCAERRSRQAIVANLFVIEAQPIEPADHHRFWRGIVNAALWSLPFWALAAAVIAVKFYGWMG
jgi:hypothetical protein